MTNGWISTRFGDVAELVKGVSYASEDYCGPGEGLVFLTIKCVSKAGGFKREGVKYFKGTLVESQLLEQGDLLIANTDLTRAGDIVGAPMVVPAFDGHQVTMSMDLSKVVEDRNKVDRQFLYYLLMTDHARRFMKDHASGSTVLHLQTRAVPSLAIDIPKRTDEQFKIAEILSTVDRAIEQTEALIAKQQRIKTGLMQDLLTRGIDEQGNLRSEESHQFKDSSLGRIPVEWEVKPIEQKLNRIIDYRGRTPTKVEAGIPLLTAKNVRDGYIDEEPREFIAESAFESWMTRGMPEPGDVLFTTEAPMGNVARVPPYRIALAQRLLTLCPKAGELSQDYLFWLLHWKRSTERLELLTSGSTVVGVKQSVFRKVDFRFPRLDEQQQISTILNSHEQGAIDHRARLRKLHSLKTALMQDLLTGEKRVNALLEPKVES